MRVLRTLPTLLLVLVAVGGAAVVAFGTDPRLMGRADGLAWIVWGRRWQWPIAALSLVACVGLIGAVIVGWRRVWWLVALAPVLWLFYQRFMGEPWRRMGVVEGPAFVTADRAKWLRDDERVVGVVFEGSAYAYPCAALANAPVVLHAEGDRRVILMDSPIAGRAVAAAVDHSVKGREMDVVSTPAGAVLLHNGRIGQFVNAFTGQTPDGKKPAGFGAPIDTTRTTWARWRADHPDTKVLSGARGEQVEAPPLAWPPIDGGWTTPPDTRVTVLWPGGRPIALGEADVRPGDVVNLSAPGGASLLLVRDTAGVLRAYDRTVKGDLFPRFARKAVAKRPEVALADPETGSLWTIDGKCVDGPAKGEHLKAVRAEADVLWGTLRTYYPQVERVAGEAVVAGRASEAREPAPATPKPKRGTGKR